MKAKIIGVKLVKIDGKDYPVFVYENITKPDTGQSWRSHSKYIRSAKHTQWNKTSK